MLIDADNSTLLIIDFQEKLIVALEDAQGMIA